MTTPSHDRSPARRVLLFTYHFPPVGGAGTQRPARFARYLPESGWEVHVLTGPGTASGRWTPRDETLRSEVPAEVRVTRLRREPPAPGPGEERIERWFRVKTRWQRWWCGAAVAAAAEITGVEAIWTIMPPYVSARPSMSLARRLKVPWIADLGDPWALDEMTIYPSGVHRALARREMHAALKDAAAVVMSTPEAVASVHRSFPDLSDKPVVAIPNGYDASDFDGSEPLRRDGKFRIVHTGYLHTELGLEQHRRAAIRRMTGGEISGVDILTRSHVFLVKAIERLLAEEPALAERLEVVFAGVLSDSDRRIAERLAVARLPGYLPHAESVSLVRSADLLFLPLHKVDPGARATIVPGKTYEYLASGRPLLAAVPEGDARDLVRAAGAGSVCDPDDVEGMAAIIRERLREGRMPSRTPDVTAYEYRELARRAASLLDDLVPG